MNEIWTLKSKFENDFSDYSQKNHLQGNVFAKVNLINLKKGIEQRTMCLNFQKLCGPSTHSFCQLLSCCLLYVKQMKSSTKSFILSEYYVKTI